MRRIRWFCCVVVTAVGFGVVGGSNAGEPPSPRRAELDALIRQVGSENPTRRYAAAIGLSQLVTVEDLPRLHELLANHPSGRVRNGVVGQLDRLGQPDSVASVVRALRSDDSHWVRRSAARALGRLGRPEARAPLFDALTGDTDPSVRKYAAVALGLFPGDRPALALRQALEAEQDGEVRAVVRQTLARRGSPWMRPARLVTGKVSEGFCKGTRYLVYAPRNYHAPRPVRLLVSIHGTHGEPEAYLEMCREDADEHNLVVLAPHFDYGTFPDFGNLNPWLGWDRADLRLLEIVDQLVAGSKLDAEPFFLFGHSQGGQFVPRFVLGHPRVVLRAAACAAGNYVHPDPEAVFPRGTKPNPFTPDLDDLDFGNLVRSQLAIVIGDADLDRRRREAERFIAEVKAYAQDNGLANNVAWFTVPEGPHSGRSNYPAASRFLFGGR